MPRYDDRRSSARLYVGHLSSRTRTRDLEDLFARYGRVRAVDMKRDYAFVEYGDARDADDARYSLDGREFKGSRIVVEFSKGTPLGPGGSRDYLGRGPPPGSGRCFNCGIDGHWARDCKAGDWKNKCYRCGDRGHIERNCPNSPKKLSREQRYSRSPSPRRGRSRSHSFTRSRSYSRSPSPVKRKRERSYDDGERGLRSPDDSRSPPKRGRSSSPRGRSPSPRGRSPSPRGRSPSPRGRSPSPRGRSPSLRDRSPSPRDKSPSPRDRSPSPRGRRGNPELDEKSPMGRTDESPDNQKWTNGSDYGNSPRGRSRSRSPIDDADTGGDGSYRSPIEENGHDRNPSPVPRDEDVHGSDDENGSPRGSE